MRRHFDRLRYPFLRRVVASSKMRTALMPTVDDAADRGYTLRHLNICSGIVMFKIGLGTMYVSLRIVAWAAVGLLFALCGCGGNPAPSRYDRVVAEPMLGRGIIAAPAAKSDQTPDTGVGGYAAPGHACIDAFCAVEWQAQCDAFAAKKAGTAIDSDFIDITQTTETAFLGDCHARYVATTQACHQVLCDFVEVWRYLHSNRHIDEDVMATMRAVTAQYAEHCAPQEQIPDLAAD